MSVVSTADVVVAEPPVPQSRSILRRLFDFIAIRCRRIFGFASLVVLLAVTATLPGLQPLALGYLLEASGRVGRSGRWRAGLPGLRQAAQLGGIAIGLLAWRFPVAYLSSLAADARLIEPGGPAERRWTIVLVVVGSLIALHVAGALLRGGKLRHFLWPRPIDGARRLLRRGTWSTARDATCDFFASLRLLHLYGLGLRGALATLVWLALPVLWMAWGRERPVWALPGGLLMTLVVLYLPGLQTQFAAEDRWRRMFAVRDVRHRFRRAPWAYATAVVLLLAASLPLYLLKIELTPRDAAWLPGIVFVLFALPPRLALGRAYAYAASRTAPRSRLVVWPARLFLFAAAAAYVFIMFLTPLVAWYGSRSLYEQHAFLFPVPFWQWE